MFHDRFMYCPHCEKEYPWHVMVCPTCDVDTVDRLPGPEPTPDAELVCVLATGNPALIAIAKSLLDGDQIDYFVKGDALQDLFGLGRVTNYSFAMGPPEFWVRTDDAERARVLLADLAAADAKGDAGP
jgi:hypothetical protein